MRIATTGDMQEMVIGGILKKLQAIGILIMMVGGILVKMIIVKRKDHLIANIMHQLIGKLLLIYVQKQHGLPKPNVNVAKLEDLHLQILLPPFILTPILLPKLLIYQQLYQHQKLQLPKLTLT